MKNFFSFFFLITILLSGCGRKAPPLPISQSIPKAPQLNVEATPFGFNLWITLPSETQGGNPLNKITSLIIEREEFNENLPQKPKVKHFKLKPKLHSAGRLILYSDSDLKPGFRYTYRLKLKKDFLVETPFQEERVVYWTDPPGLIEDIKWQINEEGFLLLSWAPPLLDVKGNPLSGSIFYHVERYINENLETYEVKEAIFKDKVSTQIKVCYRIQPLLNFKGTLIPGPKSESICYP
ncbi:hypothetical protein THC_1170 [Caldimicrobium thiodismutans]|uniref:Uncharacterized protein n=1 Tax=Caldimicrobium thiodismutans TaxID=1653476 RepID=A0A0U4N2N4_9BACT|nr:hypothetical protein [Caldimicrobium thiodismutans]BAU23542.1 hypothetical protein THC_1170 [Caldimicrobium thiodismutans]